MTRAEVSPSRNSDPSDPRCGECAEPLTFTTCSAPSCNGWICPWCGGCDIDVGDDSICCTEIDAQSTN